MHRAIHHIIFRGISQEKIFQDKTRSRMLFPSTTWTGLDARILCQWLTAFHGAYKPDISDHWSLWVGNNFFWGEDHSTEINPFVGVAPLFPGGPKAVVNPDSVTIGNIRRGDALGEMSRNTSFFTELKYLF